MKIGDYVRINENVRKICIGIGKITNMVQSTIYVNMNISLPISFERREICKSSPNIIDLIEVGDYVNGVIVTQSYIDNIKHIAPEIKENNYGIKSIVTKQQILQMEYKVGE